MASHSLELKQNKEKNYRLKSNSTIEGDMSRDSSCVIDGWSYAFPPTEQQLQWRKTTPTSSPNSRERFDDLEENNNKIDEGEDDDMVTDDESDPDYIPTSRWRKRQSKHRVNMDKDKDLEEDFENSEEDDDEDKQFEQLNKTN